MNKRGQVTVFIILAIVIVVAGILYFSFRDTIGEKSSGFSGSEAVKEFVDECFSSVSEDIVYLVGKGGGYVFGPRLSNETGFNYQQIAGENYFPTLEEIEAEISLYSTVELLYCLKDFEEFSNFQIDAGEADVSVDIFNDSVVLDLNYPVSIRKGEDVVSYENFEEVIIPVRLGEMHYVMNQLMDQEYYSENGVCISCMIDLAYEHGFVFENINLEGEDLFILIDFENEETEEPYRFVFVNGGANE